MIDIAKMLLGIDTMPKIAVEWCRTRAKTDVKPALARYRRYLEKIGLKENAIILYNRSINTYLS